MKSNEPVFWRSWRSLLAGPMGHMVSAGVTGGVPCQTVGEACRGADDMLNTGQCYGEK